VNETLRAQIDALPREPGVYIFRATDGTVLYIGKAKSLRARVRTYFQAGGSARPRLGSSQLVDRVADVEAILTSSEADALHLEQTLIKRYRPPFNIRLRDDKSFPYIAVTIDDEFPRVMFTRERHRKGVVYFGPYANAKKVRETLDVLNRVFRFRPCEGPRPGRHSGIPCLDYHIDRCLAPCVGKIGPEEYRTLIDGVVGFLSGDTQTIRRVLEGEMERAAAEERFEDAARYRNRLFAVNHLAERQAAGAGTAGAFDVVGLAVDGTRATVQVFPLRDGTLVDRYAFQLENVEGQDLQTLVEEFCLEYYASAPAVPAEIVVPREVGPLSALEALLSEQRGARVRVVAPVRGEKRRLAELASSNARAALDSAAADAERRRHRRLIALEELREALNLESLPVRIECFDVSTIQGAHTVGSLVVFENAQAKRSHYRKFSIRNTDGQDDYAALEEMISRRFARARVPATDDDWDESFSVVPNLVVVDGGRGQLSAALDAMRSLDLQRVAVVSLAKREEEVFVPGVARPFRLDRSSAGLQLLQRVRDEAHRFAVGYHRQKRSAAARESILDELPGVGPVRRRALLQHFGSVERILAASAEELEGVPGVPPKTARAVYAQLHKAGPVARGD
jgi:excinuclease ABC subunit C